MTVAQQGAWRRIALNALNHAGINYLIAYSCDHCAGQEAARPAWRFDSYRFDHDCRLNTADGRHRRAMATIRANRCFWTTLSDAGVVFLHLCALSAIGIETCWIMNRAAQNTSPEYVKRDSPRYVNNL